MRERGLKLEDIKAVVRSPHSKGDLGKGPHGGVKRKFWKSAGGRTMIVVAEIKADECWLVTGYYDS